MKSGPLNNIEKYCIQGMLADEKSHEEIAEELDRKLTSVKNYIEKYKASLKKIQTAKDMMVTKTAGKGNKGVTVMTQAASERADNRQKKVGMGEAAKKSIHKIS